MKTPDHVNYLYIEFEKPNQGDGPAMVYCEKVDGMDEQALQVVRATDYAALRKELEELRVRHMDLCAKSLAALEAFGKSHQARSAGRIFEGDATEAGTEDW